ncbi:UDP-N-acetylglucosamine 2-epimerase (non-hydrolyzing) [Caballeronia sp. NK8]|uniref:non-hydrolyzing UDP-N-acetylglucosamine 2-epimerase n=1 Tax=Caballeronia sp. NK8 TaxID=140098 RepID=UPI001BB61DEB|nr:UDP-N-acetylglucosamine 2-epimerase (non-hydrolyzing) [Caballeronia sp. NK8]BCQ26870.1 UDP-N-acetylglucosamine 2-epimerase (non-hydrolyzing) [Caballeronia sp. NK8]
MLKIGYVIGTRPEAVKCAPPILAMENDARFEPLLVSTGQHAEMLYSALDIFGIVPAADLKVMRPEQTLSGVTERILHGLAELPLMCELDAIIVHGDTASTVAGAIFGFQNKIPVIHLEAGLRSTRLDSPFPEEGNRRLVTQISSYHLAPTAGNYLNLLHEGIAPNRIAITGNTVVDALFSCVPKARGYHDPVLDEIENDPRRVVLASTHRRESWPKLHMLADAMAEVAQLPNVRLVVPVHKNPVVRKALRSRLDGLQNVTLLEPLPYLGFVRLMLRADLILSDSSGAEEEGPALGKPTLVLRDISERGEAISAGSAKLVGRSKEEIVEEVSAVLFNEAVYERFVSGGCPYGDGAASARVLDAIAHFFGKGSAAEAYTGRSPSIRANSERFTQVGGVDTIQNFAGAIL